jgi:UDPglucose--hexose-1-phosphate uridylyltransferase
MPELRIDPLSGLRAIVAGERSERPGALPAVAARPAIDPEEDPFVEGHEDRTPEELFAVRDDAGWKVRVVPNLFPALLAARSASDADDPLSGGRGQPEMFSGRPAIGAHEVIVNSPKAVDSLLDLSVDELSTAMQVWRARMDHHRDAPYRHLIVNEGDEAGASMRHTHAQLYALPFVPAAVARERERFTAYFERTQGRNLLEDLLVEEIKAGDRVVAVDSEMVAVCPFASRSPFQLQLIPRKTAARFEEAEALGAPLLRDALERLASALGALPPLNLWVRTAPSGAEAFCWRIDVVPRLEQPAGLELGTGVWLCSVAPERAAEQLRAAGS